MLKEVFIKCPYCDAEYLPEEIFMGDEFLGNRQAVKLDNGKIDFVNGDEPELESSYICDFCNKRFVVRAKISFEAFDDDFDDEYSINLAQ